MQSLVWLLSGLIAGWLARLLMKERSMGFLADVTLGILGGVSGAWMLRSLGGSVPPAGTPDAPPGARRGRHRPRRARPRPSP